MRGVIEAPRIDGILRMNYFNNEKSKIGETYAKDSRDTNRWMTTTEDAEQSEVTSAAVRTPKSLNPMRVEQRKGRN